MIEAAISGSTMLAGMASASKRGQRQGDRMRDRERSDYFDCFTQRPARDQQREQKGQMVEAQKNMFDAEREKSPKRMRTRLRNRERRQSHSNELLDASSARWPSEFLHHRATPGTGGDRAEVCQSTKSAG